MILRPERKLVVDGALLHIKGLIISYLLTPLFLHKLKASGRLIGFAPSALENRRALSDPLATKATALHPLNDFLNVQWKWPICSTSATRRNSNILDRNCAYYSEVVSQSFVLFLVPVAIKSDGTQRRTFILFSSILYDLCLLVMLLPTVYAESFMLKIPLSLANEMVRSWSV